ncbi:MAG: thymidine kinase [Deltaproteobacteria bacterium]|nr:thymidine kinase [Deltaproteobacteria bacterium]
MAKLYFRYGTVGSAKTLNLLAVAHNYKQQGKKVLLIKPRIDNRFSTTSIISRAGLEQKADLLVSENSKIESNLLQGVNCILVDEAQFISAYVIEQFRRITIDLNIPVICYGLRADFRSDLFEGSKRLLELSDSIEEIKTTCAFCNKKAISNLKHVNGIATVEGPSVDLGAEEKYFPTCFDCYIREIQKSCPALPMSGEQKELFSRAIGE